MMMMMILKIYFSFIRAKFKMEKPTINFNANRNQDTLAQGVCYQLWWSLFIIVNLVLTFLLYYVTYFLNKVFIIFCINFNLWVLFFILKISISLKYRGNHNFGLLSLIQGVVTEDPLHLVSVILCFWFGKSIMKYEKTYHTSIFVWI